MKFEETFDFDHSVETVMNMFTDETYFLAKYERMGGRKPELVNCDKKDDHFSITVRHALDASKLSFPEIIQKRIGDRVMLEERAAKLGIDITFAPYSSTDTAVPHSPGNLPLIEIPLGATCTAGNLDSANADALHDLFFELRDRHGLTIALVTHNEGLADRADRQIRLRDGLVEA